jgi:hypothetical protein
MWTLTCSNLAPLCPFARPVTLRRQGGSFIGGPLVVAGRFAWAWTCGILMKLHSGTTLEGLFAGAIQQYSHFIPGWHFCCQGATHLTRRWEL